MQCRQRSGIRVCNPDDDRSHREHCCRQCAGELEEGKTTVGTLVNVSHVAATPEGMEVRIETELTEIAPNGKMLTKVAAYDEAGLIGEGTHQRAIVAKERFEQKAQSKLSK